MTKLGKKLPDLPKLGMPSIFACGSSQMKGKSSPVAEQVPNVEEVVEEAAEEVPEPAVEPEKAPEPEPTMEELQILLKETNDRIAVFDLKNDVAAAKARLDRLQTGKKK